MANKSIPGVIDVNDNIGFDCLDNDIIDGGKAPCRFREGQR